MYFVGLIVFRATNLFPYAMERDVFSMESVITLGYSKDNAYTAVQAETGNFCFGVPDNIYYKLESQ